MYCDQIWQCVCQCVNKMIPTALSAFLLHSSHTKSEIYDICYLVITSTPAVLAKNSFTSAESFQIGCQIIHFCEEIVLLVWRKLSGKFCLWRKNDKNEDGYGARQKCRGWWVAAAVCTNLAHCGALTVVAAGSIWEKVKRVQWTLSGSKVSPSTSYHTAPACRYQIYVIYGCAIQSSYIGETDILLFLRSARFLFSW